MSGKYGMWRILRPIRPIRRINLIRPHREMETYGRQTVRGQETRAQQTSCPAEN